MMTVIIATHNGARTLPGVLDAYCRITVPEGGWKLIVVDNASTDPSREIITSYLDRLPLTYLYEGKLGKNAALNTAIDLIDGDVVLFTDDDVFPRPEWLLSMRAIADAQPSYSIFGGVILPRWETFPPNWIRDWVQLGAVFGLTSPDLTDGPAEFGKIWGGNMAIRASVFQRGFRFDATIGPRGTKYAMGSEAELVRRLSQNGYAAWHVHTAEVEHFVRDFQMQKPWVLSRAIRSGRGQYRLNHPDHSLKMASCFGVPRYLFGNILKQAMQVMKSMLRFDGKSFFLARYTFNYYLGNIIEGRNLHKERSGLKK